ncbi:hypothetical protein GCM10023193_44590 [Planotetraspora kaengkrachanensis]|uniref:histidine kinase n=1 Tax=Planotetraspora kaengkrachanensis TaxID=575193 RepID=A0A8J3PYB3_9ACTN|nr:hypothetical protein Pka01_64980 [Planotetraspora kaengkrachanensis]
MHARLPSLLLRQTPSLMVGVLAGAACAAVVTLLLFPFRQFVPPHSLGVVYLLGVLLISTAFGLWPGLATAVASAVAYEYFHLPPFYGWTLTGDGELVTALVFLVTALLAGFVADLARSRAMEAEEQRRTADLAADLAHLLLRSEDLRTTLPAAAQRLAQALELRHAAIEPEVVAADGPYAALPLRDGATQLATLLIPADLPEPTLLRLQQQVVPPLQALLGAAWDREAVAEEQAALRRVATLVAGGADPSEVFNAVTREMGRIMGTRYTDMNRFESDGTLTVLSHWDDHGGWDQFVPLGSRRPIQDMPVAKLVWQTGKPARRTTDDDDAAGEFLRRAREWALGSVVGSPIMVENQLWGVMVAFSRADDRQPQAIEERMMKFTELLGTAIANAQSRAELTASRARIIAAADESRRRIERDLHDGAQQRLVTLGLELRAAEAMAPPDLKAHLSHVVEGLACAVEDLQELSRGLHPAMLSKGGLCPALKTLAHRSSVPVRLKVSNVESQPERVEAAVYYIVSEALTNAAKHAQASVVDIDLTVDDTALRLCIRDDGIGGADPRNGSGLIGLKDRVAVIGGDMEITSPAGNGTSLLITIPC